MHGQTLIEAHLHLSNKGKLMCLNPYNVCMAKH
jgi:hypothetical protein